MWCDSKDHSRRKGSEFSEALRSKRVGLNDRGRVVYNGEELPLMWGDEEIPGLGNIGRSYSNVHGVPYRGRK